MNAVFASSPLVGLATGAYRLPFMQPFRPRWPDRFGVIVAVASMGLGLALCRPDGVLSNGPQLMAWVVAVFVLAIPFVVLELGIGSIYQDSLSESVRKAGKSWEIVGWLAAGAAVLAWLLLLLTAGRLALAAYDSFLAALANQPSPWVAQAKQIVSPPIGGEVMAIATALGIVQFRLWRGASTIARSALLMTIVGGSGMLLVGVALSLHPGAMDGLVSLLTPSADGWSELATVKPWVGAVMAVFLGWACGTGAVTAYGSYLNRSTDAIGIGSIAVLGGAIGQVLLMVVIALGSGVMVIEVPPTDSRLPTGVLTVAVAVANSGLPAWWTGALLTVWFVALFALVMPAMLAMSEAIVAPLVDKFRLPRERVVPTLSLGMFFSGALLVTHAQASLWLFHGLLWMLGMTVFMQSLCAWKIVKLDAIARHLNAYSAFRLRLGWRISVAVIMPLAAIFLLLWMIMHLESSALIGSGIALVVVLSAVLLAHLPGRNG